MSTETNPDIIEIEVIQYRTTRNSFLFKLADSTDLLALERAKEVPVVIADRAMLDPEVKSTFTDIFGLARNLSRCDAVALSNKKLRINRASGQLIVTPIKEVYYAQ